MSQINQQHQLLVTTDPYRADGQGWSLAVTTVGGKVTAVTRTNAAGESFKKTITYSGDDVTNVSYWVKS